MVETRAKLWLERDGAFILGAGRAEILRMVRTTGSLAGAAVSMGMSYSHAWSEVREMSRALGAPVLETCRGGKSGGSSRLTDLGNSILDRFDAEMKELDRHLAKRNR